MKNGGAKEPAGEPTGQTATGDEGTFFQQRTRELFFIGIILCASGYISPPIALVLGLLYGLTLTHPYSAETPVLTRFLLQASVVLLGFGMNLSQVVRAGRSGFVYTAIGITFALGLGWLLGKALRVKTVPSFLICAGTAICGGSAIAAVAPVIDANEEELAVSMGTVFVLNSVALMIFPPIGAALGLSQTQFGLWGALAIHDTSSVVGACAKYGAEALAVGTTVKLARALWIVPLTLAVAAVWKRRAEARAGRARGEASGEASEKAGAKAAAKIQWPWFIGLFVLAAVASTYVRWGRLGDLYPTLSKLGRLGLTVTLFLIGTGLSRQTLKKVGARPLLQGVALWLVVATVTLAAIRAGWVRL
jgi:uncharacterized integral membrane protein (TIGR00698 family)